MPTTLTYTGTTDDNAREERLTRARAAHLETAPAERRILIQAATTVCGKCNAETAVAVRCTQCGDWLNAAANPDTGAAEAAIIAYDAEAAANGTVQRLIPFDDALVGVIKKGEELLACLDNGEDLPPDQQWDLPPIFAGHAALEALGVLIEQLRPHLPWFGDEPDSPRITGSDGRYQHMGLRVVQLDPTAIVTLRTAATVCIDALDLNTRRTAPNESQLTDLVDAIDQIQHETVADGATFDAARHAAIAPLLRLVTVLDNDTDDTRLLIEVLRDRHHDIVLSYEQDQAYRRNARVMVKALTDANPLHLLLY
ncbi:MAG: hypothetical protein QOF58_6565 [Pseudonocardiales bacterium]|jgi:hypothetical protein|nr:hypothetical protein [Pseudonocardiales bacterium]